MPASEKTWRNQMTLHVVFGCTGLLLLIATLWMLYADHTREWKTFQRKMRNVDVRLTSWRQQAAEAAENATQKGELEKALEDEKASAPPKQAFNELIGLISDESTVEQLTSTYAAIEAAADDTLRATNLRAQLFDQIDPVLRRAKFEEENLLSRRKFKSADYDEARAIYDLGIRDGKPQSDLDRAQARVDQERAAREQLTQQYQAASAHRRALDDAMKGMTAREDEINKSLTDIATEYNRLTTALNERNATYFTSTPPFLGKRILELPILDAFNSPLKIDNLWTKNLTILSGSFGEVRRFDRCTTCHKSIDKTAPGSAVAPLYDDAHVVDLQLATPETRPVAELMEGQKKGPAPTLESVYGLRVAGTGLVEADDVTVQHVTPNTLGANAATITEGNAQGFQVGDVIAYVRGTKVLSLGHAQRLLLEEVDWGQPVAVKVVRGLPQPYASHPRLDLFVGSLSPHKFNVLGCSVCHEGQGSATEFKYASHTPNSPEQQEEWAREYGWFNNHHWIYPMTANRFVESTCLKCHHDVVELELAKQFDEPPAPKVMAGYHLIRQYGCYGCHEINGYNGPSKRVGPDMRLEPNYFAAAAELKKDPNFNSLGSDQKAWVDELIQHPELTEVRHNLLNWLRDDFKSESPQLTVFAHNLAAALDDVETPGTLRKVGPSLRHVAGKVGPTWLYDWLNDPTHFRKSTRMPRFFGQWDHLDEGERAVAERYEPIEILGIITYLMKESQPLEFLDTGDAFTEEASEAQLERGKTLFETRGCLACHQHGEFPTYKATHGPDLTNIGDKFALDDTPDAKRWFYSWLKNPSLYHPRTRMPNLYLEPIQDTDGNTTDPAADIAVFLLNSSNDWKPIDGVAERLEPKRADLDALFKEHLQTKLYHRDVDEALEKGNVAPEVARRLDGPEAKLVGELTDEKKLMYIGEKTIDKYGCFACHDISGYEKAKPIGTGLADWGRKDASKLAFEHIAEYLEHGHAHHAPGAPGAMHAPGEHDAGDHPSEPQQGIGAAETSMAHGSADPTMALASETIDEAFYHDHLHEHDRIGFIWQKLKAPRSYDYAKARNKDSYNDRLRMPLFPFTDVEREAVITFVLGLVAEPPDRQFVFQPDSRKEAEIAGHKTLTTFNCAGCHILDPETWTIEVPAGSFEEQTLDPSQVFPFMPHQFTSVEVAASQTPDALRAVVTAKLQGMPDISSDDGTQRILDEEGDAIDPEEQYDPTTLLYPFELWKPALIDGHPYQAGVTPLELEARWIRDRQPTTGGDLTKWLLPRAVELEKQSNPQADGKQAYGWLPPPLVGEGHKVQSDWLHDFLLEPQKIRPAVLMRMPQFNMSSEEAGQLANYFAARDDAAYPYLASPVTQDRRLAAAETAYENQLATVAEGERPPGDTRFDHAMNIVTSNNYCVQCHIVDDFVPKTSNRAMAPDLSLVNRRLRPDYVKRWLANPKQILPYTPMPVNVKYDANADNMGGVDQKLFHGSSMQQLDGLVDLLMNYPTYAKNKTSVSSLVKPSSGPSDAGETTTP